MNLLKRIRVLEDFIITNGSDGQYRPYASFLALIDIWKKTGMKTFILSKDLIEAFVNTDVPLDFKLADINMPFNNFIIEGDLRLFNTNILTDDDDEDNVDIFSVMYMSDKAILATNHYQLNDDRESDSLIMPIYPVNGKGVETIGWFDISIKSSSSWRDWAENEVGSKYHRVKELVPKVLNIFINSVLYINEPGRDAYDTQSVVRKKYKVSKGKKVTREFIRLRPPSRFTPKRHVKKWNLDKRFLVRGHWTHQVYGVGRKLRRYQWIMPYWKGPELSEIISKPYKVK